MNKPYQYLVDSMEQGVVYARYNILVAGWAGFLGHPLYWYLWTYILPQPYDSVFLRFSGSLICLGLITRNYWHQSFKSYFSVYWYFSLIYVLPFPFTYLVLKNSFNLVWLLCFLGMILLLFMLMQKIIWFLIVLFGGMLSGFLLFLITDSSVNFSAFPVETLPVFFFAVVIGIILMYFAYKSIVEYHTMAEKQRSQIFKNLSASIAHEVRTPICAGRQATLFMNDKIQQLLNELPDKSDEIKNKLQTLFKVNQVANEGLLRGDMITRMILKNIKENEHLPNLERLNSTQVIEKSLEEYAFQTGERQQIELNLKDNFVFQGNQDLLIFVLFNLLRNALFHAQNATRPIEISTHSQDKSIVIIDYGVGIAADKIPLIFESFVTSNKKTGTGLGLAFCQRAMKMMQGDIHCQSELGCYTQFSLKF